MVEGFGDEIERAGSILRSRGVRDWKTYNISNAPDRTPSRADQMYGDRQRTVDTPATSNDSPVEIVDKRQQMR